jgi:hypothetical protein
MFFSSVVTAIANQAAANERRARQNGSGGAGDAPNFDAILKAREESERAAEAAAKTAAANAPAFARFAEKGIDAKMVSFVDVFKEQLSAAVDTNEDGVISQAEMARQVVAGGGTAGQADALYDAMDENHDGSVSKQEFQDSTPVPFTNLSAQLLQMLDGNRDGHVGGSELQGFLDSNKDTEINAADLMANLAIKVSGNA